MHLGLRALTSAARWAAASRALAAFAAVAVSMALARLVPVEALGLFFIALPLVRVLALVTGAGVPEAFLKLVAIAAARGDSGAVRQMAGKGMRLVAWSGAGLSVLFLGGWPFLGPRLFEGAAGYGIAGLVLGLAGARAVGDAASAFLRATGRTLLGLAILGLPRELGFLVLLAGLWAAGARLSFGEALGFYFGISAAAALAGFTLASRTIPARAAPPRTATGDIPSLARLSLPIMLSGLAGILYNAMDVWVLGLYRGPAEAGLYGAAVRLTLVVSFFLNVVNLVLPPFISSAHARGRHRQIAVLSRTAATLSGGLGVLVLVLYLALGRALLGIGFGEAFRAAYPALAILAFGQAVNALSGSPGVILQMTGHHRFLMGLTAGIALANLAGNLLVVERFGMTGVAAVTVLSVAVHNLVMLRTCHARCGLLPLPSLRMMTPRYLAHLVRA